MCAFVCTFAHYNLRLPHFNFMPFFLLFSFSAHLLRPKWQVHFSCTYELLTHSFSYTVFLAMCSCACVGIFAFFFLYYYRGNGKNSMQSTSNVVRHRSSHDIFNAGHIPKALGFYDSPCLRQCKNWDRYSGLRKMKYSFKSEGSLHRRMWYQCKQAHGRT